MWLDCLLLKSIASFIINNAYVSGIRELAQHKEFILG